MGVVEKRLPGYKVLSYVNTVLYKEIDWVIFMPLTLDRNVWCGSYFYFHIHDDELWSLLLNAFKPFCGDYLIYISGLISIFITSKMPLE